MDGQQLRLTAWFALALLAAPGSTRAEPILVTLEGDGAIALGAPQSDWFRPGGSGAVGVLYPAAPWLLTGLRLRAGLLANGDRPSRQELADPKTGTFESLSLALRLRLPSGAQDVRRAVGPFVELEGGGTLTGEDTMRGHVGGGIGYGFDAGGLAWAPVLRYQQVVQPEDPLSDEDARLVMLGVEISLFDARSKPVEAVDARQAPADSDGDGIDDSDDACPSSPEDADGYQDEDGCPEPDNDGDGILDVDDQCPNEAEDQDGFKDDDGCPDPDNDADGFADADDQCPNEPEVVNGNKDYDGCPDEGLIELKDDRIVLEERVLFDFERARIKHSARPILRAIVDLFEQHPEWLKIRIEGHADRRGSEEFNQSLSERRAANVRDMLVRLGIPADTIESVGYGATHPRDLRDEEDAHRRNRRVEFVVLARKAVAKPDSEPGAPPAAERTDEPAESEALEEQSADEPEEDPTEDEEAP